MDPMKYWCTKFFDKYLSDRLCEHILCARQSSDSCHNLIISSTGSPRRYAPRDDDREQKIIYALS